MHDKASVNCAAMCAINVVSLLLVDISSHSHTTDLVGERFNVLVLDELFRAWISLFTYSSCAIMNWQTRTGVSLKSYSYTRWWRKWKVLFQVLKYFADIVPFLQETEASPATTAKLLQLFSDR